MDCPKPFFRKLELMRNVVRHRLIMVPIIVLFIFLSIMGHNLLHPVAAGEPTTTATPIKHLVVIYGENHSFDNYFATYPSALNQAGEPRFIAKPGTPSINGLIGPLLSNNPNSSNPFRIERKKSFVCDQSHDYTKEQLAYNGGLVNKFPQETAQGPD
ncbi:MAG TPA: alkaline phosphatase family protein, partial [Candidatus Caenarcaniphilales bacterium]